MYLKYVLQDYPRIDVFHFDGWVKHNEIPTRNPQDPATGKMEDDVSLGNRLLEHLRHHDGDSRKYDAVLVDEAQDFPPIWFSCILESLTDPLDGDLLIVCDGNQGIRLIDAVSWKSLGIKAQGRTIHSAFDLDRNYRNTREILRLAAHFTTKNVKMTKIRSRLSRSIPVRPSGGGQSRSSSGARIMPMNAKESPTSHMFSSRGMSPSVKSKLPCNPTR